MKNTLDLLSWYKAMGVDEVIKEIPFDNFTSQRREYDFALENKANLVKEKQYVLNNAARIKPPAQITEDVYHLVDKIKSRGELQKIVNSFDQLSITKTAKNTVFSDGTDKADIMLIGEAPGAEEDEQGIPFCGPSGKLLDQMLGFIGLTRLDNFYITNTIFWRPPGNRKPTPEEVAVCRPFVEKHIELISPKLIILIGSTAVSSVLQNNEAITKIRGKFFAYQNRYLTESIPAIPIFHPSYLLRSPGQKRFAWQDCCIIREFIDSKQGFYNC